MDQISCILGHPEGSVKPEVLLAYAVVALSVSIFVNWALAVLLFALKPFTCAGIK